MSSDIVGRVFVHKVDGGRYRVTQDNGDILLVARADRVAVGLTPATVVDSKPIAVDRSQFLAAHVDVSTVADCAAPPPIAAGHTVRLRCGGLAMVVESVVNNAAWCLWHDQEGQLQKEAIALGCLQRAE